MMTSTRVQWRPLLVAGTLTLGLTVVSPALKAAPTVWLMTFSIDDGGSLVSGDGQGSYQDYRLPSSDDVNECVEASPFNNLLFIRLNRPLDGDSGTTYCGQLLGTPRQFSLTITVSSACAELAAHGYPTASTAPCTLTGLDKPRIRISSDLYAKQTTKTAVAFLTAPYNVSATSYEVRTETDASVLKPGLEPSVRIVTYSGSARLWRFEPGVRARAVADAFSLPFQMTFTRTAQ